MEILAWSDFTKRRNSTKQPANSNATSFTAYLKEGTSIESPTFKLSASVADLKDITYVRAFDRYYFVRDIVVERQGWADIICTEDVLATHKTDIGNYTAYVERAASSYDVNIEDSAVSMSYAAEYAAHKTKLLDNFGYDGIYVARVIGGAGAAFDGTAGKTGISSYVLSSADLKRLIASMFEDTSDIYDFLSDAFTKSFFNPFQYVVSLKWFPINRDVYPYDNKEFIRFGWWQSTVEAFPLTEARTTLVINDEIEEPAVLYNDFRDRSSAWTEITAYFPGVGSVNLAPIDANTKISYEYTVDLISGTCSVIVKNKDGENIARLSGSFGIDVQIGQLNTNYLDSLSRGAGAFSSAVSGNLLGAVTSGVSAIKNITSPTAQISGAAGSMADLKRHGSVVITRKTRRTKDIPTTIGRPLCKNVQIGTLSGYVQCAGASVPMNSMDGARSAVNNFLNGGFFYE